MFQVLRLPVILYSVSYEFVYLMCAIFNSVACRAAFGSFVVLPNKSSRSVFGFFMNRMNFILIHSPQLNQRVPLYFAYYQLKFLP